MSALAASAPRPLVILLLVNGLTPADLTSVVGSLKENSKSISTHSRREFYWSSYEQITSAVTKLSNVDKDGGKLFGLVKYSRHEKDDDEGDVTFEEFTRNQKGLVNAGASNTHTMLGKKFKVLNDGEGDGPGAKEYMMAWFDDAAAIAYTDITANSECIAIDAEKGVYVLTGTKRKLCRGATSAATKNLAGLLEFIATLAPNSPLQSISWNGNRPPAVNEYNVVLSGTGWSNAILKDLPDTVGHVSSTSTDEIYSAFKVRKNQSLIGEAEALINRMLSDVGKGAATMDVYTASMKELGIARRNAILKKVYVCSSKKKFIESVVQEGDVEEMYVVEDREVKGKFEEYGSVVFETFYKLDISIYS